MIGLHALGQSTAEHCYVSISLAYVGLIRLGTLFVQMLQCALPLPLINSMSSGLLSVDLIDLGGVKRLSELVVDYTVQALALIKMQSVTISGASSDLSEIVFICSMIDISAIA